MYNNYVKIYNNDTCQIQESTERRMGTSEKEGKGMEKKRERIKTVFVMIYFLSWIVSVHYIVFISF